MSRLIVGQCCCTSVQRAPAEVCSLFEDVQTLSALLAQAQSFNRHGYMDGLAEAILGRCEAKVAALYAKVRRATDGLASESARKRKWSALKIAMDKADITELHDQLKETKALLLIVKLESFERSTSSKLQAQEQILLEVLQAVRLSFSQPSNTLSRTNLEWQHSDMQLLTAPTTEPPRYPDIAASDCPESIDNQCVFSPISKSPVQKRPRQKSVLISGSRNRLNTPFGPLKTSTTTHIRTDIRSSGSSSEEQDTTYFFYPSWLFKRVGISYGLWIQGKSTNGWQYTVQPFNAVPDDAPIIHYCQTGDVAAIKTLLSCGYASLRDRDTKGRTPLWYASSSLQVEVVDFLLEHGADPHVVDWETEHSPIATLHSRRYLELQKRTTVLGVYERYAPDGYDDYSVKYLIGRTMLAYRLGPRSEREASFIQFVSRIFELWCPDDRQRVRILRDLHHAYTSNVIDWLLNGIEILEDETLAGDILHDLIIREFHLWKPATIKLAMQKMPSLHIQLGSRPCAQALSTATSFVMISPENFFAWRDILLELGHDLEEFVFKELEHTPSPLAAQGWTQTTLLALFRSEKSSTPRNLVRGQNFLCDRCGREDNPEIKLVDLHWRQYLQGVREGKVQSLPRWAEVKNITIDFREEVSLTKGRPLTGGGCHDLDQARCVSSSPYKLVCRPECVDSVCVSRVFDGSSAKDVIFPSYPQVLPEGSLGTFHRRVLLEKEDSCPRRMMPGAFGD
ncbi:hypothetical protein ONS95_014348 [Cadophora gregata]|uniref:uncharacterized protein n=1 Tax=Cadophora gregata TaxID=51156 RepID=UPI0026DA8D8E|nr:uncharacterized protein ONS95_014348 [Cadophora gregata]KAK0112605.1 hypothetical protein ONS95_014348 [Cadophora gregata]